MHIVMISISSFLPFEFRLCGAPVEATDPASPATWATYTIKDQDKHVATQDTVENETDSFLQTLF